MPSAKLIIRIPGQPPHEHALNGGAAVGHAPQNTIPLPDAPGVGFSHVMIEARAAGFRLRVIERALTTLVNDQLVTTECPLTDGARILLGGATELEFRLSAETDGAPAAERIVTPPHHATAPATRRRLWLLLGVIALLPLAVLAVRWGRPDERGRFIPPPTLPTPTIPMPSPAPSIDAGWLRGLLQDFAVRQQIAPELVFSDELVAEIGRRVPKYDEQVLNAGLQVQREICTAFGNHNLPPPLGLTLAASRSRFRAETGLSASDAPVGLWRLPPSLLRAAADELADPKRAAEMAADYAARLHKQLTYHPTDYVYLIACYGLPPEQLVQINELLAAYPHERRDFWLMRQRLGRRLPPDAVERVAEFFAAGVTGFCPAAFNLRVAESFAVACGTPAAPACRARE